MQFKRQRYLGSSIEYWSTRLTLPSQKYQERLPPTAPVVCLSNQAAVNPASDWRTHLIRGAYHAGIRHGTHHHWKNDTSVCAGMNLERYKHISITISSFLQERLTRCLRTRNESLILGNRRSLTLAGWLGSPFFHWQLVCLKTQLNSLTTCFQEKSYTIYTVAGFGLCKSNGGFI